MAKIVLFPSFRLTTTVFFSVKKQKQKKVISLQPTNESNEMKRNEPVKQRLKSVHMALPWKQSSSSWISFDLYCLDLTVVKKEVMALEEMARQLFLEIVDLNSTLDRIHFSKTFMGKYFNFMGFIFANYCAFKVFLVSRSF